MRDITISGGVVTATGKAGGAGIGSGSEAGFAQNITISGGTIEATGSGSNDSERGPGIGSAVGTSQAGIITYEHTTNINISGGRIEATG